MSVLVLVEGPVKPDELSNMKSYLAEILPDTRSYEGCESIDAHFNTDDGSDMVLVERWVSRPQHEKYLGWRTETGVMQRIGGMLSGPPSIRYLERAEA